MEKWEEELRKKEEEEANKMKENDWECESCNTRNQWVKNDVNSSRCSKCFIKNKMIEEIIIVMSSKKWQAIE